MASATNGAPRLLVGISSIFQRDFGMEPTSILSGEIGTVTDTDNSYHVVTVPGAE